MKKLVIGLALLAGVLRGLGAAILPTGDAVTDTSAIQNAINAGGAVELGEGTFLINDEIKLETGATVSGQGYEKTILKQTTSGKRVMSIGGGSKLIGVTLTGGKTAGGWAHGGGATVANGTISWCCISNNAATAANSYGGGVFVKQGTVDHSIIADNICGNTGFGGGISTYQPDGAITIDSCLVRGNKANYQYGASKGGAIGLQMFYRKVQVTVRNTTIVGNVAGVAGQKSLGGAVYTDCDTQKGFAMINCILADNTTVNTDVNTNLRLEYNGGVDYCLFDSEADKLGANSKVGDPKFKDALAGNYMIAVNSPAKGAGRPDSATGTDLAGADYANPPSMGCYEYVASTAVEAPVFEPESCLFYPSVDVTLASETEGAAIYYTLDESEPTEESKLYDGPINLTDTTTVKARAYKTGLSPSEIVSETYTLEEQTPPEIGEVIVTPFSTAARFSGTIAALGNYGAMACDVYLKIDDGEATKVASGVVDSFSFVVPGLTAATSYTYVLSIFNNAPESMSDEKSGEFETNAARGELEPGETPAETRQAIQDAIGEAALEVPVGTVLLGKGVFEIDAELTLDDGVTLVGQGWTNTVIKQTVSARVITLDGGAKVEGVTLTGGKLSGNWSRGGGALVNDGMISWCCISNNVASGNNIYGGGIRIYKGQIDHSVIANNKAGDYGTGFGAGICYYRGELTDPMGPVLIDTCLICCNVSNKNGGGVFDEGGQSDMLTIRNTTIAGNSATEKGGGLRGARKQLTLVNCILADNTATDGANYSIDDGVIATVAEQTQNCFFGNGSTALGETSVSGFQVDFKDAENGDYRLKATSQAAEVGAWYAGITDDLDGTVRKDPTTAAGCYECTEIDHGVVQLNPIIVTATTTTASLTGSIASLGEGTSATVTLNYGLDAEALTEKKELTGVVTDFAFDVTDLTHATHYFYSVTVENDVGRSTSATGDFFTQYDPEIALKPSDDPAQNVATLSAALMAAAPTHGTITLGEGVFAIDDELTVGSGITLVGQGWEKTVLRQTASGKRVLTLDGGATLKGVTVTGGFLNSGAKQGGGAYVNDGTITWCCISNNAVTVGNSNYGGGVFFKKGQIDHSIIANNEVQTTTGSACLGGGIGTYQPSGVIVIDTCLVEGNQAKWANGKVKGGGIGIHFMYQPFAVTIRNTTITGNVAGSAGGAVCTDCPTAKSAIKMLNCIVAANTTEDVEATVALDASNGSRDVDHCVFDVEADKVGEHSAVGDPLFKDAANGDYRVHADSPAVAVGQWYKGIVEDLDGKKRGRKPVAGCYTVRQGLTVFIK